MSDQTRSQPVAPGELPEAVTRYLAAHQIRDARTAIICFADDATVTDDGKQYRGRDEILDWLSRTATEYTYTTELVGAEKVDDTHFVVTNHLEGDFPGGTVDLRYQFTLHGQVITELTIAV
jgi:ketosteroid isomerase-like protein